MVGFAFPGLDDDVRAHLIPMARTSRYPDPYPANRPLPPGMKRTRKGRLRKRSLTWRFRRVVLLVGLMGIVAVSGGAYVVWESTALPEKDPPLLQTSFICASDVAENCNEDNSIAQLSGGVDRVTVTYDQIPAIFVQALVSAEDKDFFKHEGIDPVGIGRALYTNVQNETVQQGGSTITQQYVKNVYLTNEVTLDRKLKEAVLAIKLDQELPKQEILERYLNTIYFGRGAYGIEAASRAYFAKHVEELGLPESAYLASIIRFPEGTDANRTPDDPKRESQLALATTRRGQVLDTMLAEGYINQRDHDDVDAMGWDYVVPRAETAANYGTVARPELGTEYFIDYVRHWMVASGGFTDSEIYGGGLRIYTTLDFEAQAAAYDAILSTLDRPDDPSASIVSMDDQGRVKAMVGGFDHEASQVNLAVGQEGGGSGRQPGSSFKPLVLAEYIKQGKSLGQVFNAPAKLDIQLPGELWSPANYGDSEQGQLNVVDATRFSSNTAYAQIIQQTGVEPVVELSKEMGITGDLPVVPSLVLGTGSVSVLDMASAYSTFANSGEHVGPYVVTKVTNAQGQVLWEAPFERKRVLDETVAQSVNWVLNQVVESGTGTSARFGQPVAGKTGTTDEYRDAWFVGYTCKLTAAVWVGYPDPNPDGSTRYMKNVHGISVAGGTLPTQIFNKYMSRAAAGLESCAFPRPADATLVNTGMVPTYTGTAVEQAPGTDVTPSSSTTTTAPVSTTSSSAPPTSEAPTTTEPATTLPPTTPAPPTTAPTTVAPAGPP